MQCLLHAGDLSAVPNLGFKKSGRLVFNAMAENYAIDDLPEPDSSDLSAENYCHAKRPLGFMLTSRGCPYHCSFCSVQQTFGAEYRRRSAAAVLQEMKRRYAAGVRVFDFEDDNLSFDRQGFKELLMLLGRELPADVRLLAMNGMLYHALDEELLQLMRQAGFRELNLSLVSNEPAVCEAVHRPHDWNKFRHLVGAAHSLGFRVVAYQILGLPQDTVDGMSKTMAELARLPVLIGASPFYLTPGSPIAACFPPLSPDDIVRARLTAMAVETSKFSRDDLYTLFITARIINFIKGLTSAAADCRLNLVLTENAQSGRVKIGCQILDRLLNERRMNGYDGKAFHPLEHFRFETFAAVWSKAEGTSWAVVWMRMLWSREGGDGFCSGWLVPGSGCS